MFLEIDSKSIATYKILYIKRLDDRAKSENIKLNV